MHSPNRSRRTRRLIGRALVASAVALPVIVLAPGVREGVVVPSPPAEAIVLDAPRSIAPTVTGVHYGFDAKQFLNVYPASGVATPDARPSARPTLVYLHGGGWIGGDPGAVPSQVLRETTRGYHVVSVGYRLAPAAPYPAAVEDVQDALRYLRDHAAEYGIDPDNLVVAGDSSGGNLAAMAATAWNAPGFHGGSDVRPRAWISLFGVLDVEYFAAHSVVRSVVGEYLGRDGRDRNTALRASPTTHLDPADPPGFIVSGAVDAIAPGGSTPAEIGRAYGTFGRPDDLWRQVADIAGCDNHDAFCGVNWRELDRFLDTVTAGRPL